MEEELNLYQELYKDYSDIKSPIGAVRYLSEPLINKLNHQISHQHQIVNEGNSVLDRVISSFEFGQGSFKILIWSQMHGNESTTTKAVYDLIYYFLSSKFKNSDEADLLNHLRIKIIPVLNPDGSFAWTRTNANQVDLNRDAKDQSQPETKLLMRIIDDFKPDFCFNMHDQRSVFEAEESQAAQLSFLSASYRKDRSLNETRLKSMHVINSMHQVLQKFIPEQIGRYDDAFNINCFGDYLHAKALPTVLVEAGHSGDDYTRDKTRQLCFISLMRALIELKDFQTSENPNLYYHSIPENSKNYTDLLIKNYSISETETLDISIRFREILSEKSTLIFEPYIDQMGKLDHISGHRTMDAGLDNIQINSEKIELLSIVKSLTISENDFVMRFEI